MLQPGSDFGGYQVVEIAGRGAMATTYRALRHSDGRTVALKIPKPRFLTDPTFVLRFLQEAHFDARLRNRFVARVLESGEVDGIPFMAMEFLHGMTLKETLAASGPLSAKRALQIVRDVAEALEHAHAAGIVHRDLKPENIMLRVNDCLKVMDFGIAKVVGESGLTASDIFIGSPAYAAPEMTRSGPVDHRVDLYATGIILFEMLQGRPPFTAASPVELLLKQCHEPLPALCTLPIPVPRPIWRLVENLTEKDPARRLPDARSLRLAVELLLRSW